MLNTWQRGALVLVTAHWAFTGAPDRALVLLTPLPGTRLLPNLTAGGFWQGSAQPITK